MIIRTTRKELRTRTRRYYYLTTTEEKKNTTGIAREKHTIAPGHGPYYQRIILVIQCYQYRPQPLFDKRIKSVTTVTDKRYHTSPTQHTAALETLFSTKIL